MISPEFKADVLARWQTMDARQRKLVVFCAAVALMMLLGTLPLHWPRLQQSRTAAPVTAAPAVAHTAPVMEPAFASGQDFTGRWRGNAVVGGQGACTFSLEIRPSQPGQLASYPEIACVQPGAGLQDNTGASAIMKGTVRGNAAAFQVESITTASGRGCMLASPLEVRSFGVDRVAVAWKDSCGGGNMLLARQAR